MGAVFSEKERTVKQYLASSREFRRGLAMLNCAEERICCPRNADSFLRSLSNGGVPLDPDAEEQVIFLDKSDAHTLVVGPTGLKKTRLVAMPTVEALSVAGESMIISDPKAEIYDRFASRLLDCEYQVKVLDLRDPRRGMRGIPSNCLIVSIAKTILIVLADSLMI